MFTRAIDKTVSIAGKEHNDVYVETDEDQFVEHVAGEAIQVKVLWYERGSADIMFCAAIRDANGHIWIDMADYMKRLYDISAERRDV